VAAQGCRPSSGFPCFSSVAGALQTVFHLMVGRALPAGDEQRQRLGVLAAIPYLGLDALASASYGPEAALTVLMPLSAAGVRYVVPLMFLIIGLLLLVQLSYRQTIAAYPDGGGAYSVATRNLGLWAGLLAGSALWVDYVLNVAVAISAGVGALVSMVPALLPHTLALCLTILALLTIVNLRGARDSGMAFSVPTYLFVGSLGAVLVFGCIRAVLYHTPPVVPPPRLPPASETVTLWLLIRAFSSGCTAMTGVEAVSNAVPIFREPRVPGARRALLAIVAILTFLLAALAILCRHHGIGATPPGQAGYQSVISQVTGALVGRGAVYDLTMASVVAVVCLSANTSFAGFPRLCRVLAMDQFLPSGFGRRGARLVYSRGIVLLSLLAGALLIAFGGITDRLIPLFAVGAFLAFTMSQLGMVGHWRAEGARRHWPALVLNGAGALATFAALVVIVVSKLTEGAWITLVLLGVLLALFRGVRAHFCSLARETAAEEALSVDDINPPLVVVTVKRLDRIALKALHFALSISPDVLALQLLSEEPREEELTARWEALVGRPLARIGRQPPRLVVLRSATRQVVHPVLEHVERLSRLHPGRSIAVLVPELVERRWYNFLLHDQTATALKAALLLKGGPQVAVINTPFYA
jgi:amino acid transporter